MKTVLIILAAGQGTRLRPLTDNKPKCMIEVHGKPILQWQVETATKAGLDNIVIVKGYLGDTIDFEGVTYLENPRFAETNMVETLFCSQDYFSEEIIISYGDIIYEKRIIDEVLKDDQPISVVVDREWRCYWEERFENPLEDAQTLIMDSNGKIIEIGQKPEGFDDIHAQYIGLTVFRGEGIKALEKLYNLEKDAFGKGQNLICKERNLSQLYMTDFIQGLINQGNTVSSIPVSGGWLEIDSFKDLTFAEKKIENNLQTLQINRK